MRLSVSPKIQKSETKYAAFSLVKEGQPSKDIRGSNDKNFSMVHPAPMPTTKVSPVGRTSGPALDQIEAARLAAVKASLSGVDPKESMRKKLVTSRNSTSSMDRISNGRESFSSITEFWQEVRTQALQGIEYHQKGKGERRVSAVSLNLGQIVKLRIRASRAKGNMKNKVKLARKAISPKSNAKKLWDLYIGLLIFYYAVVGPLRISFSPAAEPGPVLNWFEFVFSASFWIDIVISFDTAFYVEERLIYQHRQIAKNYLRGWFWVDVLAAFPFAWFVNLVTHKGKGFAAAKLFKMLRLVRLAKIFKLAVLLKDFDPTVVSISKTMSIVILAAHFLCCIWFFVSCNWRINHYYANKDSYDFDAFSQLWLKCGSPDHLGSMYLSGFYFVIFTILSIGYGEIHGDTINEMVIAILIEIGGAMLFGLIIAVTKKIIHVLDPVQEATAEAMRQFQEYIDDRGIIQTLQRKLKRHYGYYLFKKSVFDEDELFKDLPMQLRYSLAEEVYGMLLSSLSLFEENITCERARFQLAYCLKPMQADTREYICEEGCIMTEMYLVVKGKVQGMINDIIKGYIFVGSWGPGSDFGLDNIINSTHCSLNFISASPCDLFWLNEVDIHAAVDIFPSLLHPLAKKAKADSETLAHVLASSDVDRLGQFVKEIVIIDNRQQKMKKDIEVVDVARKSALIDGHAPLRRLRLGRLRMVRTWRKLDGGGFAARTLKGTYLNGVVEMEETVMDLDARLIIFYDEAWLAKWNVMVISLLVFSAIVIPVRVAFNFQNPFTVGMDSVIDPILLVDILLKFRSSYEDIGYNNVKVVVTVPKMIALRYLKSWLVIDVLSSFPFDLITHLTSLTIFKLLRIVRLLTFSKVLRGLAAVQQAENKKSVYKVRIGIPDWFTQVCRVFATLYFSAHLFGCFWYACTRNNVFNSWWVSDGMNGTKKQIPRAYLASVYYAMTTMATVGYGDIHSRNDAERVVACVIMLFGGTMFGYVVGNVSSLARDPHGGTIRRSQQMQHLSDYLESKQISMQLRESIKVHMKYFLTINSPYSNDLFLSKMPPHLRQEVVLHIHQEHMLNICIFNNKENSFKVKIMQYLKPIKTAEGDHVFSCDEISQGIYFVTRGSAEVYTEEQEEAATVQKTMTIVTEGKLFGYFHFLVPEGERLLVRMGARAVTRLQCFLLRMVDVEHICRYHTVLATELRIALEEEIWQQARFEMRSQETRSVPNSARSLSRIVGPDQIRKLSLNRERRESVNRRGSLNQVTAVYVSARRSENGEQICNEDKVVKLSKWVSERINNDNQRNSSVSTMVTWDGPWRRASGGTQAKTPPARERKVIPSRHSSTGGSVGSLEDLRFTRKEGVHHGAHTPHHAWAANQEGFVDYLMKTPRPETNLNVDIIDQRMSSRMSTGRNSPVNPFVIEEEEKSDKQHLSCLFKELSSSDFEGPGPSYLSTSDDPLELMMTLPSYCAEESHEFRSEHPDSQSDILIFDSTPMHINYKIALTKSLSQQNKNDMVVDSL